MSALAERHEAEADLQGFIDRALVVLMVSQQDS